MKHFLLAFSTLLLISCGSNTQPSAEDPKWIKSILKSPKSLGKSEAENPISAFTKSAEQFAERSELLTKSSISSVLELKTGFQYCAVVVEDHTLVIFRNTADCKQSGSWGACMPKAEGYIKKGELIYQKDYINNLIGMPDNQKRTAYFFGKTLFQ